MRIEKITLSNPTIYDITKIGPFNSVEIKSLQSSSFIEIQNKLGLSSYVTIPGTSIKIGPNSNVKVYPDALFSLCQRNVTCKIDINISNGSSSSGSIGSITLDMQNSMNITETYSFRPSEIYIEQTSLNAIVVKYTSFK